MQKREKTGYPILAYIGVLVAIGVYICFWMQPELLYNTRENAFSLRWKRVTVTSVALLLGIYGCLMKKMYSETKERIRSLVMYGITPFVVLFFTEFANIAGPNLFWREITLSTVYRTGISAILMWMIILLLIAITGSIKFSCVFFSIVLGIFTLICQYVYKFRGVPLLASDLVSMGTAMDVMDNYDYSMRFHDKIMLIGILVWCFCLIRTKSIKILRGKKRIIFSTVYIVIFVISCCVWIYTPITVRLNLKINTYRPIKTYKKSGTFLNFVNSFYVMVINKPDDYNVENVEKIADKYRKEAAEQGETVMPNLIVVMDEAFADLQNIWDFETSEEIMPFYHSLKENTVKGTIYVPYFGAQTANSEFEVLSGLTKAFLPAGATPYQLYINQELPNLNTAIRNSGEYQGILAMHPWYPEGYNREVAYQYMGFSDFISIDDMDYTENDLIRKFISDKKNMEMIISEYEEAKSKSDKLFYMFNVTMQNHSGYELKYDNFDETITIEKEHSDPQAMQYVNLVKKSDEALEYLISYFEKVEEPTVVMFFGDHQPSVSPSFYESIMGRKLADLNSEECMDRYRTPFLIWANYDIPEEENVFTSTNYLTMLMKRYTGMEMTPFECFLQNMHAEIPVISVNGFYDKNGEYYEIGTEETPYDELLNEYWMLEYNTLFDMENRIPDFFD